MFISWTASHFCMWQVHRHPPSYHALPKLAPLPRSPPPSAHALWPHVLICSLALANTTPHPKFIAWHRLALGSPSPSLSWCLLADSTRWGWRGADGGPRGGREVGEGEERGVRGKRYNLHFIEQGI
jgi:hypothetical protein